MTRTGGVPAGATSNESPGERSTTTDTGREARKPQGRRGHGLGVVARNERRSGMVREAGSPRTARRGRHTPKGCGKDPRERRPSRSVRRGAPGGNRPRAGDEGFPRHGRTLESPAGEREPAPGERRDRRRTATRRPEGAEDAPAPLTPGRVTGRKARDRGQANTPGRPGGRILQYRARHPVCRGRGTADNGRRDYPSQPRFSDAELRSDREPLVSKVCL
jgi:hypothetical protein